MHVLVLLPPVQPTSGNRQTADRYATLLEELGHTTAICEHAGQEKPDVLIAIHGEKCHDALAAFRRAHRGTPTVLVLAGTDIYPEPSVATLDSMRRADRLVTLQERALCKVPPELRSKATAIVQSAEPLPDHESAHSSDSTFDVCVVGHLRGVKDPLRAASASRLVPPASRIRILHAGRIREDRYKRLVEREERENPRYSWLGELAPPEARALIATSRLQVLSSIAEGGAQVLGESIVSGTPLLSSRHDAALALLGEDYPGLFDIGDTAQLAALMTKAETDPAFLAQLGAHTRSLAPQFDPKRERDAWRDLLSGLCDARSGTTGPGHSQPA